MRQSDEEGPAPMSTDLVDELLRADEEELKAKRTRLRAFSRALDTAREAIRTAQESGETITERDGLSRADMARTFGLTSAEKSLLLPTRRRSSGAEVTTDGVSESNDADGRPDDRLDQQRADGNDTSRQDEDKLHEQ